VKDIPSPLHAIPGGGPAHTQGHVSHNLFLFKLNKKRKRKRKAPGRHPLYMKHVSSLDGSSSSSGEQKAALHVLLCSEEQTLTSCRVTEFRNSEAFYSLQTDR